MANQPSAKSTLTAIPNVGDAFRIPKGTVIHSMHPRDGLRRIAGRTFTVYPYFVDIYGGGEKTVVTWAGKGGYWQRVSIVKGELSREP